VILSADSFGGLKNNLISKHIMATVTLPKDKLELVYSQLNFLRNYVGLWSLEADEYVVSAVPVVATPAPVVSKPAPVTEERLVVEPTVSSSPSSADAPSLFGSFSRSFRS
jgi:hypothetical protein